MNLLETGDQQVNAECDPYLGSHCVFARPEEGFDSQVLLDPFKEKFDLPSPFVDSCDCQRRQIEVVRQEDEALPCVCIEETDTPKFTWIVSFGFLSAQSNHLIATKTAGLVDRSGLADVESGVLFRPYDKISICTLDSKQSCKVNVSAVEDINTSSFNEHLIHKMDVMNQTVCNLHKHRDRPGKIDLSVKLYRCFFLSEICPRKHRQAQINRGRINGINHLVDVESVGVFAIKSPCLTNQNLRQRFVDAPISAFVCVSKVSAGDIATNSHPVKMRASLQASFDVPQTLSKCDLSESHCQKLISRSHAFAYPWHRVKRHAAIELLTMDEIGNLSENKASSVHALLRMDQTSKCQLAQMRHMPFNLLAA